MIGSTEKVLECLDLPAFLLSVEADGRVKIAGCNVEWCAEMNVNSDDVIGHTFADAFDGEGAQEIYWHHCEAAKSKDPTCFEQHVPTPEGCKVFSVTLKTMPVVQDSGQMMLGVCVNKTAEIEAREAQAEQADVLRDIEDFVALAAHDLRTPMRNVGMLADMLKDGFKDMGDGKLELIELLEGLATKSGSLISELLSFTQAGHAPQTTKTFTLDAMCAELMDILDPTNQHSLKADKMTVEADQIATQLVLRNLIDNAIKYGCSDSVAMRCTVTDLGDGMLSFTVSDNGKGFADPSLAFLDGGEMRVDSGYGLMGVRRIIRARDGSISATNLPNKTGGMVRFSLPGQIVPSNLRKLPIPKADNSAVPLNQSAVRYTGNVTQMQRPQKVSDAGR